jgi:hypothetical protein
MSEPRGIHQCKHVALILGHLGDIIHSFLGDTFHSLSCRHVSNNDVMLTRQLQKIISLGDLNSQQTQTFEAPKHRSPQSPEIFKC